MENIYIQKLEIINFTISKGIKELSENLRDAKQISECGRFVLKLYLEEKYFNNKDFRSVDLEEELLSIQRVVVAIYDHLEEIVINETEGFEDELNSVYTLI